MLDHLAGCMKNGQKNILVLGREIRKMFGHINPADHVSPEMKAIIAHELGHARYADLAGMGRHSMSFRSPVAGLLAGIAGVALAKHIVSKHPEDKAKQSEELNTHHELTKDTNGTVKIISTLALYVAGAALGLVGGVHVGKMLRHGMEYRADRFSAELMGDGKPLARALKELSDKFKTLKDKMPASESLKRFSEAVEGWLHPPIEERISRMESFRA